MNGGRLFELHKVALAGVQLIEASAGTGKTFSVSVLYVRALLEQQLRVRDVLVVTFTKAAAGELRERIRQRVADALAACEGATVPDPALARLLAGLLQCARLATGLDDAQLAARLRLALQEFDQAAIHTIHGFCQRALADVPFVAGVPLQTELLADDGEMAAAVMRDTWRQHVQARPLPPALAAGLLARKSGPVQVAALMKRHQAKPLAQVRWPPECEDGETRLAAALPLARTAWTVAVALWRQDREAIVRQLLDCAHGLNQTTHKPAQVAEAVAQWDALAALEDPLQGAGVPGRLHLLGASRLVPTKAARKAGIVAPGHPFFAAADDFVAAWSGLEQCGRAARAVLLRGLLDKALSELARRKREARVQTYDDLLTGLRGALRSGRGEELAASLRARYRLALVDEFQDTDPVQLDILQRIWHHPDVALFLVGDPKQAIYAFRNADLHCYLQARAGVAAVHTLAENQRASGALIDALNALFGCNRLPFLLPGLDYPPVTEGGKPRRPLLGDPLPRAALQVWLLPRTATSEPLRVADARQAALAACADEIVRLLQEAGRDLRLDDQPLRAGDIAVLVRSHRDGRAMRAELSLRGVGSVELSQASVFASLEAEELLRVLAAVLAPAGSGQVLAALATTLFGRDAAAIDEVGQDERQLAWWVDEFAQARRRWGELGFAAMFWPLAARHGLVARLLASGDGARRVTNLRQLAELLHAASARLAAPEALHEWLRRQVEQPDGDEERQLRLDSDAALVQIVTVHRAKGLEYPVVFCPLLWGQPKAEGRDALGVREYHLPDGTACIDYRDDLDLSREEQAAIRVAQSRDRFAEDLRLLYVALTRAANRCYLVGGAWRGAGSGPLCTSAARTALAWLVEPDPPSWEAWRDRKLEAEALDSAWHALAGRLGDGAKLAVDWLPADAGLRWQHPVPDPALLQAAAAPWVPPRRRIGSYSALVQERAQAPAGPPDEAAADHDLLVLPPPASAMPAVEVPPLDILRFPRGAEAGTCLHAVLEGIDFGRPRDWPAQVGRALSVHASWLGGDASGPAAARWPEMLLDWLRDLAAAPLPDGIRLSALDARRCLHELEFHLPSTGLDADRLRALLARHGHATPGLRFDTLNGHLKGFIDLVVEHGGRWYVIDWKSNHLGDRPEDYHPDRVRAAVADHDYALQALLYLLALDRLLRRRLAGYRPGQHLGGALYLFVRGVRPDWRDATGQTCGTWFLPAPLDALRELDQLLAGHAPRMPA